MARRCPSILFAILADVSGADARSRAVQDSSLLTPIMVASPALAPFQHVRFCLRYPSDCESNPTENESIELTPETSELLRVNHNVNMPIIPTLKNYGQNLGDAWTIAPGAGDCNDCAVTMRIPVMTTMRFGAWRPLDPVDDDQGGA
jgi:predicted transglutaminase-like cysteine proteinase